MQTGIDCADGALLSAELSILGPLHGQPSTQEDCGSKDRFSATTLYEWPVRRRIATGRLWPIVRTRHAVQKPPFAQRENNQTPINNEGVWHGILLI